MSFRNHCLGFACLALASVPAYATPLVPDGQSPTPALEITDGAGCQDTNGNLTGATRCAEYLAQLRLRAEIAKARADIAEAEKRRKEATQPSGVPAPETISSSVTTASAGRNPDFRDRDRTVEIFGEQARIHLGDSEYLVRTGSQLPDGRRVVAVTADGARITDGRSSRLLPLITGGGS